MKQDSSYKITHYEMILADDSKKKSQCLKKTIKINLNLGALASLWLWQLYLGCSGRGGAAPWPPHLLKLYSDLCKCLDDDGDEHILWKIKHIDAMKQRWERGKKKQHDS